MMNELRIGMVGYKFMGKAHSNALQRLGMFFDPGVKVRLKALCGRDPEWVRKAADQFGFEDVETDWEKLVARPDIDVALYVGDDRTDADAFAGLRALAEEGRLRRAICVGVRSDETPPEIEHGADALVDGTDGVRALLETLAR